ncbi:unnamed protein product [Orchesella dallaii]|uniref:CRIB domain-containing protein n=1 Tax=Orchesella dallaii TaxID=48710 RepID=A0ABP1RNF9_9HEXA
MKKGRIRKEDIGGPSNFVHVQHVGFGPKSPPITTQKSLDLGEGHCRKDGKSERFDNGDSSRNVEDEFKVEMRHKCRRQSQIPLHHRSTMAVLPDNTSYSRNSPQENEILNQRERNRIEASLKPTFGSLLNLSFLPLGLGKSSSKSPSVSKTKRMSLLNLTASNLFANPKALEGKRESVHMTGYIRRRSISSPVEDDDVMSVPNGRSNNIGTELSPASSAKASSSSSRVPLAKLGRSKSTMSELSKRPKLRLKIPPPSVPPPVPVVHSAYVENLPSPPPSPVPSPPSTPLTAPVAETIVVLRPRPPNTPPRSRIIPLPSTDSVDSVDPTSPQYLTPAGGSSPQPSESAFPLLSPTLPPTITPLYTSQRVPGTPPIWPLQPTWPPPITMQQKEATIPEIPSPSKDEMETTEYEPVVGIVDSFISENGNSLLSHAPIVSPEVSEPEEVAKSWHANYNPVNAANIERLSCILRDSIQYKEWPSIAQKLFQSVPSPENDSNDQCERVNEIYGSILTKTLEMWVEMAGDHATVDTLAKTLSDVNPLAAGLASQVNLNEI